MEYTKQLDLSISGIENDQNTRSNLITFINEFSSSNFRILEPEKKDSNHLGVDPLAVLSIILGSGAVIELVKALHTWIQATRPKVHIKISKGDLSFEIDAENLHDEQLLIKKIRDLFFSD
jgi:hypothetical protein